MQSVRLGIKHYFVEMLRIDVTMYYLKNDNLEQNIIYLFTTQNYKFNFFVTFFFKNVKVKFLFLTQENFINEFFAFK